MSCPKKKIREVAAQLLFALEMGQDDQEEELFPFLMQEFKITRKEAQEVYDFAGVIFSKKDEIDQVIASLSETYDVKRIGLIEKSILRMTFHVLETDKNETQTFIVNEALRLASKFCSDAAVTFIHGILEGLLKRASVCDTCSPLELLSESLQSVGDSPPAMKTL